ncbi:thiamine diphosphokinase [Shimia sp.]|uniref:thiamine diphosphokinase n=1 Tax=Shimia sp. TaxID=1954381 RepID=UPI0032987629
MRAIVHSSEPITLVGAGQVDKKDIIRCLDVAPTLVSADGGAAHCLEAGLMPEAVIGDMDSLDGTVVQGVPADRIHRMSEQESTDFEKSLRSVTAPLILGVGFTGARLDHQLACYNALVRHPDKRCILLSDTDIAFLAPPSIALSLEAGTRVSLFPMGLVEGVSDGLRWPINGLVFTPDGRIGTSNQALGPVTFEMTAPKMLIILPRDQLEKVVLELAVQPGSWPAL